MNTNKLMEAYEDALNAEIAYMRNGDGSHRQANMFKALEILRNEIKRFNLSQQTTSSNNSQIATPAQISYLRKLNVQIEAGMSKRRASQLIDAAKSHILGSVNGFYADGSN